MASINSNITDLNVQELKYSIKNISQNKIQELYDVINIKINEKFINLNTLHKNLLKKYLLYACILCAFYFQIDKLVEQFSMNNAQDIFSILNMLLPYYELNHCVEISSLDELFLNKDNKARQLESTYYIDHEYLIGSEDYLINYFENCIKIIANTFDKVSAKLLPNWINIFPLTLNDYKQSNLYQNFMILRAYSSFQPDEGLIWNKTSTTSNNFSFKNFINTNYFLFGYNNLYGCIYNFLYFNIKDIKWMIFDKKHDKIIYPSIILLGNFLGIQNIANTKWEQLEYSEQKTIYEKWSTLIKNQDNLELIKSVIIFYLRYEYDQNKLNSLGLDKKCISLFRNKIKLDISDDDEKDEINIYESGNELNACIQLIASKIKIEYLYEYIYKCIQKFKYTWYGFKCLDSESRILSLNNYIENCVGDSKIDKNMPDSLKSEFDLVYITPKNIYNYFKSIIHNTFGSEYKLISSSHSWDSLTYESKKIFINRLNQGTTNDFTKRIPFTKTWFNIIRNLKRIYGQNMKSVGYIYDKIVQIFVESELFVKIIFETMIFNGLLSYFKYNPKATDSTIMPNKNLENGIPWRKYILSQVDIKPYADSYNFLSNKKLSTTPDYFESVKKSMWYTNFGGNWIAQLQMFHHLINQRLLMITGATGAGKSTVAPFMVLYGLKMLNFDNNVKVICTQPRKQPTVDNAVRIADSLGVPIKDSEGKYINRNITYIQFKHQDLQITDDEYHPCLRMVTDGTLLNMLTESYMLKKPNALKDNDFVKSNLFNGILVDEAHEHNSNMDMILTIMRLATYINNQVTLGIISATMDEDEPRYRKYYQMIDDNWKWPLNLNYLPAQPYISKNYNSNLIDRRIHLSPPFFSTNFKIEDKQIIPQSTDKLDDFIDKLTKAIIEKSNFGDILIFQNGQNEIIKLVDKLNSSTPANVLAVPFYSELNADILENYIKNIGKSDIRKKINIKKTVPISKLLNLEPDEKVDEGTYSRFIIVATNIAEASITIDTLKFVIDIGTQKNNIYDPNRDISNLKVDLIANPNRKQRRGRVGRVAPGTVYYLYDITKLREEVVFKICIQNITQTILELITNTKTKLLTIQTDPYFTNSLDLIPEFLKNQYMWINSNGQEILYSNVKINNVNPIYPNIDGRYEYDVVVDNDGKFYLIHPNEDNFVRDQNLNIIERINYINKPERIIQINKLKNVINENNELTPFGKLILNMEEIFLTGDSKFINLLLNTLALGISIDSVVFRNIILFIILKNQNFNIKNKVTGKSDFFIKIQSIPDEIFKATSVNNILINLDTKLENLDRLVKKEINNNNIKNILENYKYFSPSDINNIIIILDKYLKYKVLITLIVVCQPVLNKLRNDNLIGRVIDYNKKEDLLNKLNKVELRLLEILENNEKIYKINLNDNVGFSFDILRDFNKLSEYEKTFILIIKNFPYNLLQKVSGTNFYIEFFNRDVNRIYRVKSFSPSYNLKKIIIDTKVSSEYLNNFIYFMNSDDTYAVSDLSYVNSNVIKILYKMLIFKNMIFVNKIKNEKECYKIYGDIYKKILEKIDKILEII
jgi:hypothetical protein